MLADTWQDHAGVPALPCSLRSSPCPYRPDACPRPPEHALAGGHRGVRNDTHQRQTAAGRFAGNGQHRGLQDRCRPGGPVARGHRGAALAGRQARSRRPHRLDGPDRQRARNRSPRFAGDPDRLAHRHRAQGWLARRRARRRLRARDRAQRHRGERAACGGSRRHLVRGRGRHLHAVPRQPQLLRRSRRCRHYCREVKGRRTARGGARDHCFRAVAAPLRCRPRGLLSGSAHRAGARAWRPAASASAW